MTGESTAALLAMLRVAGYAGFVVWAGPLLFWTLVWPAGHRHRRLHRLSAVGAVVLILTSVTEPTIRLVAGGQSLAEVAPPLAGAAVLVRLAVLVASLFYLVDLANGAVVGSRRVIVLVAVVVVAATVAVQPTVLGQAGPVLAAVGTAGQLFAAAAWLGGLVALATVVRPGTEFGETGGLVTRFSRMATLGLVLLVLASGLAVLAGARTGADSADEREGPGLLIRLGLLAALLVVAWYAQRITTRLAFRRLFSPLGTTGATRDRTMALVVGTELAIAFGALSAAMLVVLTPG